MFWTVFHRRYTAGSVMTAIFGILNGGMQLGQSSMYIEAVNTARAAAVTIYQVTCITSTYLHSTYIAYLCIYLHLTIWQVIDRQPAIDSSSSAGARPASCEGSIVFSGVGFSYPSRREVTILDTFNLDIQAGAKVRVVK